jgi:glycosyltransferase involved in cell wall biosynthesis
METTSQTQDQVTFFVCAYRQEEFIREAVAGALAQTYSPLEIILSDDCSPDRTFAIMQQIAASYAGPHRLVLNRNPSNIGLAAHFNRIVELATGELLIGSAGDDISLPNRTSACYEAWEQSGRRATSIHSDYLQIDRTGQSIERVFDSQVQVESGRVLEQPVSPLTFVRTLTPQVTGCAHSFSRQLFDRFGPLPENVVHEDEALAFRSVLAGRILYINSPLVKYRLHASNLNLRKNLLVTDFRRLLMHEEKHRRFVGWRIRMYEGFRKDLESARDQGLINQQDFERTLLEIDQLHRRNQLRERYLNAHFLGRFRIFYRCWREGLAAGEFQFFAPRLLPRAVLLGTRLLRNRVASRRK